MRQYDAEPSRLAIDMLADACNLGSALAMPAVMTIDVERQMRAAC